MRDPDRRLVYQPALDGLRAVAALGVVGFHLRLPGFAGGGLGVDIFFTLSGFLISSIILTELERTGRLSFRSFYIRRGLRLLPVYFATVAVALAGYFLIVAVGGTLRGAAFSFFYIANWAAAFDLGLGTLAHTWSLSVEEQFYFLWPVLLVLLFRRSRGGGKRLLISTGVAWGAMWAVTLVSVFAFRIPFDLLNNGTPFRATELLAGCLLAVAVRHGYLAPLVRRRMLSSLLGIIAMLGLVTLIVFGRSESNPELVAIWIATSGCTALLIASVQGGRPTVVGRVLSWKPLVAIGIVSYGVYLWHFPVMVSIDKLYGLESFPAAVAALVITAILVTASYFLLEKPFLRLKGRFEKGLRRAAPGQRAADGTIADGDPAPL
jgi:peptidoglycan/LPS O-acetylase OafA/YrhL